ncbi:MAG: hypothetical protein WCY51_00510 [Sulfurimonas sp.]|uniref:hypothetical protein n=1 Tax=Sulfurimonas sp. TaxID=2022749 RepID=UPI0025E3C428|nr:hypothetical protein [Sulfurimonas sp.]MCK9455508.1 hypothetical protein [Sulfurimonas sp.]
MNRKSELFFYSLFGIVTLFIVEVSYLYLTKSADLVKQNNKNEFVKIVQLPDLSISTEASYIRHRSLSDFFSIYKDDGALREYFASTYVFSSPDIVKNKRENEK